MGPESPTKKNNRAVDGNGNEDSEEEEDNRAVDSAEDEDGEEEPESPTKKNNRAVDGNGNEIVKKKRIIALSTVQEMRMGKKSQSPQQRKTIALSMVTEM